MNKQIKILPDKTALISASHQLITEKILKTISENDLCTIALAGGSTPKPIYELIAKENLPWDKIHIFWGDERYVDSNHPDSNEKMAREAWLNQVDIPAGNIHPMPTNSNNPALDAHKYEQELLAFFDLKLGEIPHFDLILLGIGDDGHTASLFPHTDALKVHDHLITVGNKDNSIRLTFTIPLINGANCVMFIASGENKQTALTAIFSTEEDNYQYPARFIQPQGELWWLLDESAAETIK